MVPRPEDQRRAASDEAVHFALLVSRVAVGLKRHRDGQGLSDRDLTALAALADELEQAADTIEFVQHPQAGRRPAGHLASVGATIRAVGASRLTDDERSDISQVLRDLTERLRSTMASDADPDPSLQELMDAMAARLSADVGSPGDVLTIP